VLVGDEAGAAPRPRPSAGVALRFIPEPPIAYLRHIDPVPLRFQPKALPPAPWPETAAAGTAPGPEESASGQPAPESPVGSEEEAPSTGIAASSVSTVEAPGRVEASSEIIEAPAQRSPSIDEPARAPSPILVDELRPTIRPEDFLPFFVLPGARAGEAGTALIVPVPPQPPAPTTQPPSSARFIQTP
jgi:hypothetical protein